MRRVTDISCGPGFQGQWKYTSVDSMMHVSLGYVFLKKVGGDL